MKKLFLIVLLILCSCESDFLNNALRVGKPMPSARDIRHKYYAKTTVVEENSKWIKYRVYDEGFTHIRTYYVTVKNDTIVSVWNKEGGW